MVDMRQVRAKPSICPVCLEKHRTRRGLMTQHERQGIRYSGRLRRHVNATWPCNSEGKPARTLHAPHIHDWHPTNAEGVARCALWPICQEMRVADALVTVFG